MCVYIVIGVELAALYALFWLFFEYEPKPYKIVGDPWGTYGAERRCGIDDTADPPFEIVTGKN